MHKLPKLVACSVLVLAPTIISASTVNHNRALENLYRVFHHKPADKKSNVNLLFIQQAARGKLTPLHYNNCYRLQLSQLKPHVLYFSDEPKRLTGRITVSKFIGIWKHNNSQYGIKPNVAIQAVDAVSGQNRDELNVVSVLSNPHYNVKKATLTYTACVLGEKKRHSLKKMKLKNITLFFDPFHPWPP